MDWPAGEVHKLAKKQNETNIPRYGLNKVVEQSALFIEMDLIHSR